MYDRKKDMLWKVFHTVLMNYSNIYLFQFEWTKLELTEIIPVRSLLNIITDTFRRVKD